MAAEIVSMSMNALGHFGRDAALELLRDISMLHLFWFAIHLPLRGRRKKQWVVTPSANLAG